MQRSLSLTWFLDKGFSLHFKDQVSHPTLGYMEILTDWDKAVALSHHEWTQITLLGWRVINDQERKLGMPNSIKSSDLGKPDMDILISMQNMDAHHE